MGGDREESKIPITAVVGLAVAMATLWFVQEPLKTSRPEADKDLLPKGERVQARLWQDPIEAVEVHRRQNRVGDPHDLKVFEQGPSDSPTLALLVLTVGSPYAESHEKRLRDRYAILSALSVACFRPEQEEHIGYFTLPPEGESVPFEWYKARKTKRCYEDQNGQPRYDRVLVVWVSTDILGRKPVDGRNRLLDKLNWIAGSIAQQYWGGACRAWHSKPCLSLLEVKIIGPPSSSMLRAMLEEAKNAKAPLEWPNWRPSDPHGSFKIKLYSPWATAAPEILLYGLPTEGQADDCKETWSGHDRLSCVLAKAGVVLEHAVQPDEESALALVRELERRRVKLGEDPIALIGEWDTFYGRALPLVFRAAACVVANERAEKAGSVDRTKEGPLRWRAEECRSTSRAIQVQITNPETWDRLDMKVSRYSYLRGLDGMVPGEKQHEEGSDQGDSSGKAKAGARASGSRTLAELERPEGQSQLDYLRRLVAKMNKDADKASGRIGKPPKAIGILGTDVYDTLLILKAVREEFPGAIFFATDLDARLLHESEYKWTRNLVMTAPVGLELHNALQQDIPPFRDSYQTSGFFATLRALGHVRPAQTAAPARIECPETHSQIDLPFDRYEIDLSRNQFSALLCPRLFEVGRHGAVDLSAVPGAVSSKIGQLESIQPVHKLTPDGMRPWWQFLSAESRIGFRHTVLWVGMATLLGLIVFTQIPGRVWNWARMAVISRGVWNTLWTGILNHVAGRRVWLGIVLVLMTSIAGMYAIAAAMDWLRQVILRDGWEGEPLSFSDGVSTWPSITIRFMAVAWCVGCLIKARSDLRLNQEELREEFGLEPLGHEGTARKRLLRLLQSITWMKVVPQKSGRAVGAEEIWQDYSRAALYRNRVGRSLILFMVYLFLIFIILANIAAPGMPSSPCRGSINCMMNDRVTLVAVLSMVLLNMVVFDAVLLCQGVIARLNATPIIWPPETLERYRARFNVDHRYLPSFIMVRFIADHTHAVHKLVFYPFVALFLMILSRNRVFDNWDFPVALIIVWLLYAGLAAGSTIILRSTSKQARDSALSRLREQLVSVTGMGEQARVHADQLRLTIETIERIRKGAYAPLALHPAFSASLLAAISFLQYWYLGQ